MNRTLNDEIKEIGLRYYGHGNVSRIQLVGTSWSIEIPINRVGDFTRIFPDIDWENSEFLSVLKGRYIRVTYDENMRVYAIHHITKSLDYMINKEQIN